MLAYTLAEKKEKTLAANHGEMCEVKALFKTLAYRLAEVKAKRVSDMLDHVKAKALVKKFPATLPEMKA